MAKTIKGTLIKHGFGVVILIAVFILVDSLGAKTDNEFAIGLLKFYYLNFALLVVITILHLLADIFECFSFPVNLPFPVFKAFAVTAAVIFLVNFIEAALSVISLKFALAVSSLGVYVYRVVFVIILFISLFGLFKEHKRGKEKVIIKEKVVEKDSTKKKKSKDKKSIFHELKGLIYDSIVKLRKKIKGDE